MKLKLVIHLLLGVAFGERQADDTPPSVSLTHLDEPQPMPKTLLTTSVWRFHSL
jgi:hypothetical protein